MIRYQEKFHYPEKFHYQAFENSSAHTKKHATKRRLEPPCALFGNVWIIFSHYGALFGNVCAILE